MKREELWVQCRDGKEANGARAVSGVSVLGMALSFHLPGVFKLCWAGTA